MEWFLSLQLSSATSVQPAVQLVAQPAILASCRPGECFARKAPQLFPILLRARHEGALPSWLLSRWQKNGPNGLLDSWWRTCGSGACVAFGLLMKPEGPTSGGSFSVVSTKSQGLNYHWNDESAFERRTFRDLKMELRKGDNTEGKTWKKMIKIYNNKEYSIYS